MTRIVLQQLELLVRLRLKVRRKLVGGVPKTGPKRDASQLLRSTGTRIADRLVCQRIQHATRRVSRNVSIEEPRANLSNLLIVKFFNRALDLLNGAHGRTLRKPLVRASRVSCLNVIGGRAFLPLHRHPADGFV